MTSFGKIENFVTFQQTEATLGWRVLRPSDTKYILGRQGGILRTLPGVNLPRIEQAYYLDRHGDGSIVIFQQPEIYGDVVPNMDESAIGPWHANVQHDSQGTTVVFFSGEMVSGQRVLVRVTAFADYSQEELLSFVASLSFGS